MTYISGWWTLPSSLVVSTAPSQQLSSSRTGQRSRLFRLARRSPLHIARHWIHFAVRADACPGLAGWPRRRTHSFVVPTAVSGRRDLSRTAVCTHPHSCQLRQRGKGGPASDSNNLLAPIWLLQCTSCSSMRTFLACLLLASAPSQQLSSSHTGQQSRLFAAWHVNRDASVPDRASACLASLAPPNIRPVHN